MQITCCQTSPKPINRKMQIRDSIKAKINNIRAYEKQKQADLIQAQINLKNSIQSYEKQKQADVIQAQIDIKKVIMEEIEFIKDLFR